MKTTPQLGAQSKQQLKDEHRDRMVRIAYGRPAEPEDGDVR